VAATKAEFNAELTSFTPHVILSDFSLPGFSGEEALAIARGRFPHIPFIVLSGTIDDEAAVALIKQGATDYVLKDRPQRLAPAIRRAVAEAGQWAQRARLEAQLQQSQRLESLGQLAGGVAHDFNNLLGVISSYAAFAGEELAKDPGLVDWPELRDDIEQIERAVARAAGLTRQLLAFGRREVAQPRVLDVNEVVAGVTELLIRTLGEHIELVTDLAGDLGPVLADPGQLEQVLVNLAVNARDAMPGGGTLSIDTASADVTAADTVPRPGLQPGRHVSLKVSDTGTGIPAEIADRVFEPFFTTKPRGEGTGLGLATVYGIISQAGGTVRIYSEPGRGTTMTILLPVTGRSGSKPAPRPAEPGSGDGKVVLLVEDEEALREVTRRMLDRHGYQVLTAASGPDAVSIAAAGQPIDLLVTDVVMPHMLGREVADRVCDLQPGIRVLFMSGYTHGLLSAQGVLEPGINLIEKPFTQSSLLAKLAEVTAPDGAGRRLTG
jgi:signal transduction histidine kinase